MSQWYVKDLGKLTGVSVQTLHNYDRIDLLKPSVRLPNGYRVYSEKDLLRLQQIIALKFFGFELVQIKTLLTGKDDALSHFAAQAKFLEQKSKSLLDASKALKDIISDVKDDKSIPWETIIKLIEVYRMTQQLDQSWVKEIFTPEEFQQYKTFETDLISHSTPDKKAEFRKNWLNLVKEVENNINQNPKSAIGIRLGKKCMDIVNDLYGKKYAHLRTKIFEQGFGEGRGLEEAGLTPKSVAWLDVAVDAYWRDRIFSVLAQVGKMQSSVLSQQLHQIIEDMYGDDNERKKGGMKMICDAAMKEDISLEAKKWLKEISKS